MSAELIDPDGPVPLRPNIHPVMNYIGHRCAAGFPQNPDTRSSASPGGRSCGPSGKVWATYLGFPDL